jgi:polar amino acid transport system substrate-binding protein
MYSRFWLSFLPLFFCTSYANSLSIYSENFPPFNYQVNGKPVGPASAVVNELQRVIGSKYKITFAPWPRIYNYLLHRPNVAVFTMARSKSREDTVKWVGPILNYSAYFFASSISGISVTTLDEAKLVGSIGLATDSRGGDILAGLGFRNVRPLIKAESSLKQLMHGRVSLWLETKSTVRFMMRKHNIEEHQITPQFEVYRGDLYLAFSLGTDDNIVNKWREALSTIKSNGRFEEILNAHGMSIPK